MGDVREADFWTGYFRIARQNEAAHYLDKTSGGELPAPLT